MVKKREREEGRERSKKTLETERAGQKKRDRTIGKNGARGMKEKKERGNVK